MKPKTAKTYHGAPCKHCGGTLKNDNTRRCVDYHLHKPKSWADGRAAEARNRLADDDLSLCRALVDDGLPPAVVAAKFEVSAASLRSQLRKMDDIAACEQHARAAA